VAGAFVALTLLAGCSSGGGDRTDPAPTRPGPVPAGWLYQLTGYPGGRLDGSIENYRPEYSRVQGLKLNRWNDWPDEYFVR
jgi:hypothetical protein